MLCHFSVPPSPIRWRPPQPWTFRRRAALNRPVWCGMSLINSLKTRLGLVAATNSSRGVAKERLSIILAHQRGDILLEGIDLKALQAEVYECVKVGFVVYAVGFSQSISEVDMTQSVSLYVRRMSRVGTIPWHKEVVKNANAQYSNKNMRQYHDVVTQLSCRSLNRECYCMPHRASVDCSRKGEDFFESDGRKISLE